MPVGHYMDGEWRLEGCRDMYIDIPRVINLINFRKLDPSFISINEVAYKELAGIDINGARYIAASTRFPCIVVEGMQNPHNKKYRLIDGRHRLLKIISEGKSEICAYVLTERDVMQFCGYL